MQRPPPPQAPPQPPSPCRHLAPHSCASATTHMGLVAGSTALGESERSSIHTCFRDRPPRPPSDYARPLRRESTRSYTTASLIFLVFEQHRSNPPRQSVQQRRTGAPSTHEHRMDGFICRVSQSFLRPKSLSATLTSIFATTTTFSIAAISKKKPRGSMSARIVFSVCD